MSVQSWFAWLGKSSLGVLMQKSTYGFAAVEVVHLLALAVLGGTVLLLDLRLLGIILRTQLPSTLARDLGRIFRISLIVMIASGITLLSEESLKCYYSPAFRIKMLLLFLAVVFYFTIHRWAVLGATQGATSLKLRAVGLTSLSLWLGVGLAGRAIGLL